MCLSKVEANNKMVSWGCWHWKNAGYGENLGYTTDGKMHSDHLATGACGGGNKIETFDEMPDDIAETDAKITQLSDEQIQICKWLFHTDMSESKNSRILYAKTKYANKYEKSFRYFETVMERLWSALIVLLDSPKISEFHPYHKNTA